MLKIAINTIAVGAAFGATAYAGPEGMPGNISVPVILAQVTPEKPAPVNPAPSTSGSPFDAGLADRRAYEEWFASLTGDFKRGVEYWAGQRSLERPGSCYLADGTSAGEWTQGVRRCPTTIRPERCSTQGRARLQAGVECLFTPGGAPSGGHSNAASRRAIAGLCRRAGRPKSLGTLP